MFRKGKAILTTHRLLFIKRGHGVEIPLYYISNVNSVEGSFFYNSSNYIQINLGHDKINSYPPYYDGGQLP